MPYVENCGGVHDGHDYWQDARRFPKEFACRARPIGTAKRHGSSCGNTVEFPKHDLQIKKRGVVGTSADSRRLRPIEGRGQR